MNKYVIVLMSALLVAGCSSNTIDPNTNPELYKARKALTLPKETCVKYPTGRTKCM